MNRKDFLKMVATSAAAAPLVGSAAATAGNESPQPAPPPTSAVPPGAWTLVVLPDTQSMAIAHPDVFYRQTEWIAANRDRHNIRFVAHLGDIVNNNSHPEWLVARRAMDKLLAARIPYCVLPGNHDLGRWGWCDDRSTHLNDYFSFWDHKPSEAVGYFERTSVANTWHRLTTPTGEFLVVALEFGPRNAVLDWASQVVSENPGRDVIVVTHAFLYCDSTRYDWARKGRAQRWNPKSYPIGVDGGDVNDAEEMWTKFVSKHVNIRFVLSGHVLENGTGYLVSEGEKSNRVHQILANYQGGVVPDRGFGGAGFTRLMQFMPDRKTVEVKTYSPWYDRFLTEPDQQFVVTL